MTEDYIIEVTNCGRSIQKVNMKTYACTCMDWKTRRAQQPMLSPRRLCKHLVAAICENGLDGEYPDADLQALYKKKKGFSLPAKDLIYFTEQYFQQELTGENLKRFEFLFQSGNSLNNFNKFQKLTESGTTICCIPSRGDLRIICDRLAWVGFADNCKDKPACDLLEGLELKELKKIGTVLGEKFGMKKTAIKALHGHPELDAAFAEAGFNKENFFSLKPITLDMLR